MKLNGSQIIVECLVEEGVDVVFGYPGGAVLNIYDELYKNSERIKHILTSHEQGASHAADGYARSTGKVGVVIATSGPGATNLVTGIATAYMDSVPMVAITGNVTNSLLVKDSFQEVDIAGITFPITKHNYIVKDVNDLDRVIKEAFILAKSGRPGPILIDIPKDVTAAVCEFTPNLVVENPKKEKVYTNKEAKIKEIAKLIMNAKKPFIYAGGGIIKGCCYEELNEFANLLNIPVATSLMGIGAIDQHNPLSTGLIGMHGTIASNKCVVECDLLLTLGARFSDRVLSNKTHFAEKAKIVHVDIDQAEINKNIKVDVSLVSNLKDFFKDIKPFINKKEHPEWINTVMGWKKEFASNQISNELRPRFMMEEVYRATNGDCFICTEVGQHQLWAAQYFMYSKPKLITSGGLGTMGFGLGASIGTQIGNPDSFVFNVAGDGSFRMNFNELLTISHYQLPICVVVCNNGVLGMVRQWQTAFYAKRYSQTVLDNNLNYEALAKATSVDYYEAKTKEEFSSAIEEIVKNRRPCILNSYVEINEKVLPMVAPSAPIDNIMTE